MRFVVMMGITLLILVGCGDQPVAPTPAASPAAAPTTATEPYPAGTPATESYPGPADVETYPEPLNVDPFAYPSPEGEASGSVDQGTPEPFVVPTPSSAAVGNVTGRILQLTDGVEQPFTGGVMYLGTLVKTDEGIEGLARLDRGTDPQSTVDAQGNFVFTDVAPNRYGLWLVMPVGNPLLLKHPETGADMIIEVTGGEVTELGELGYEIPGVS